ncbi:hypothetical protein SpCBS45565_g00524 [Spizellomyces sp. 'palustris']|nr:hypothetical protein SpCBS45565_g00524 [Spizellomyces sp. 'palustris']
MGRKQQKGQGGRGGVKSSGQRIEHKEAFQRMNFLYQAAVLMASTPVATNRKQESTTLTSEPSANIKQNKCNTISGLGRFYAHTLRQVERKLVLRSHPYVKRTMCKYCEGILLCGVTASVRTSTRGKNTWLQTVCKECQHAKSLPVMHGKELHAERAAVQDIGK